MLVALGTAGVCSYVAVSSYFLATNIITEFQSAILNSTSGGSGLGGNITIPYGSSINYGPFKLLNDTPLYIAYIPFHIKNNGSVGLDIKQLVIQLTITFQNGTSLMSPPNATSIPYGASRQVNVTAFELTFSQFIYMGSLLSMNNMTFGIDINCAVSVALPASWGVFAFTISNLDFNIDIPEVHL